MTRKEEKIKASKEYGIENPIFLDGVGYDDIRPAVDFSKGIEWADSHPVNQWHKTEDEIPPRKSEDSHQSLVVIVSDGFDFEKAYYDYFYGTWVCNNITPSYWMKLLKPEE